MTIAWTQHRFSGGVLALNVTNTVVHRDDPALSFDRFEEAGEIARFAEAANVYCADELGGRSLSVSRPDAAAEKIIALREATDRLFRHVADKGTLQTDNLSDFMLVVGKALEGHGGAVSPDRPFGNPEKPLPFEAGVSFSALSLLQPDRLRRIRVCRNCAWLFLDRSRNASRLWCDMAVCGNRQKAKRHYRRRRAERGDG
ncbi:MAG TPA: CGNR zinc finger domain-containing protein [Rhizobiaceae bacterium]|nr:CGNR zinc finger domain-containing protein [Rhizobiaceae bacterium]